MTSIALLQAMTGFVTAAVVHGTTAAVHGAMAAVHGTTAAAHGAMAAVHGTTAAAAIHGAATQAPNLHQMPALVLAPLLIGVILVPSMGILRRRLAYPTMLVVFTAYLGVALKALVTVLAQGTLHYKMAGWAPPVGIEWILDPLSAFVVVVLAVVAVMVAIYSGVAVGKQNPEREVPFYSMMVVMMLGLTGMVMTGDLFNLYVFFEVSSLSAYALMAVGEKKAPVSSFRYLMQGTIGASSYLLGVGYLYVLTGSLNMADVASLLPNLLGNPALTVAVVFMVVGLGLKMALFPMHLWLPDAYTYASTTSTSIIAPVMTKVSAYVLIRMIFFVFDSEWVLRGLHVGVVVTWLSMVGVIWGSVMAIAQRDVKRMLAYSSIAQVGYIGVGIGTGNPWALVGAILHIMNHATMKSSLFMVTGIVEMQTGKRRLAAWTGLGRKMPWTFLAFTFAALAMMGVPPTNGFFSKWYLAVGLASAKQWVLLVLLILSSLLTAGYFFRLLERIYARTPERESAGKSGETGGLETSASQASGSEGARTAGSEVSHAGGSTASWAAVGQTGSGDQGMEVPVGDPGLGLLLPPLLLGLGTLVLGLANTWFVTQVIARALPASMQIPGLGG